MKLKFHKHFKRQYKKLSVLQKQIDEKLILFKEDPFNPSLNNHPLFGKYLGYRSIDITSDYRAVYRLLDENTAYFKTVDNHNNLYK